MCVIYCGGFGLKSVNNFCYRIVFQQHLEEALRPLLGHGFLYGKLIIDLTDKCNLCQIQNGLSLVNKRRWHSLSHRGSSPDHVPSSMHFLKYGPVRW